LPDSICNLKNLSTLKIICSNLEVLPEGIGFCSNIEYIIISSSKLSLNNIPPSMILCVKLKTFNFNNIEYNIDNIRNDWKKKIMSYNENNNSNPNPNHNPNPNPNPFYTKPIIDVYSFIKWSYKTHNTHPINTQNTITTLLLIMQQINIHIHIQKLDKPINNTTPINAFVNTLLIEDVMSNIIYGNYDFTNINKSILYNLENIENAYRVNCV